MDKPAIISRLPKDFMAETTIDKDGAVVVSIVTRLCTVDQAEALRSAIDLAIIPLLGLSPQKTAEDAADIAAAEEALCEPGERIGLDALKDRLGHPYGTSD